MNVTLYGGSGRIGTRILNELTSRGHQVTAVARDVAKIEPRPGVRIVQGDLGSSTAIENAATGSDAIISSYGTKSGQPDEVLEITRNLIQAMREGVSKRLMVVGGASSLEIAPGRILFDEPTFPEAWKPAAGAHKKSLGLLRASDINWTYFSPAMMIQPGVRTGQYRLGGEQLVTNAEGKSEISMEDYAVAMVDELERGAYQRARFTVAY
jgi:putative NADH-flavin reductase